MAAILAYITTQNREQALAIGRVLVESRLAACINVLPDMQSVYRWEGEIEDASECVLLVKSDASRKEEIISKVKELHTYKVPCIIFWPLAGGNPDYLGWIEKESGDA